MFPWEITIETINQFYTGPYLFSALYRVYRGAYFGQGFQLTGQNPIRGIAFQLLFESLPIGIREVILNKVWNGGKDFNVIKVSQGELLLPLSLHYLFAQYGRLKRITQPIISRGCGAWNGTLVGNLSSLRSHQYIFEYGTPNLQSRVLIPDFLNSDHDRPIKVAYSLLCP